MTHQTDLLDLVLNRLRLLHPKSIDLSLDRISRLLSDLDNPHHRLPPIVHVAGTNGKGSVIAFLRAILETAGWNVHVYTSPHLVRFNERIRLAGQLIDDDTLIHTLERCENINNGQPITFFEIITAATFLVFSETPADVILLETGLGGRFDATNVIDRSAITAITRISFDHIQFLGTTLAQIAYEKAGIFKHEVPIIMTPQPAHEATEVLKKQARAVNAPIYEWYVTSMEHGFYYHSDRRSISLPRPKLIGQHQIINAGAAIACSELLTWAKITDQAIHRGLDTVEWPGRLQRLISGPLVSILPLDWELWLDGGHNDSAGDVLAEQAKLWHDSDDSRPFPLHLIVAMQANKDSLAFLRPLGAWVTSLSAVPFPIPDRGQLPEEIVASAHAVGIYQTQITPTVTSSLLKLVNKSSSRVLICGSLYLAGAILHHNH